MPVRPFFISLLTLLLLTTAAFAVPAAEQNQPDIATFSVVAYDPSTGEVGVAVQSRFFAVGSVVPYAKSGVGAVATQAFGNTTFGPLGLPETFLICSGVAIFFAEIPSK